MDVDDRPLLEALLARGIAARPAIWSDPDVDWRSFSAAILRNPWDYTDRRDEFLAWVDRAAAATKLWNPAPVIHWNTHKFYLRELAAAGIPTVPTEYVTAGTRVDLSRLMTRGGWDELVLKPAVGAGSRRAMRVDGKNAGAATAHLATLGDALIQPYLPTVDGERGERSLIFLGGQFSHAIRKNPGLAADYQHDRETLVTADAEEIDLARTILGRVPHELLYGRVDLLRDAGGTTRLMELEIVEPRLFLRLHPPAAARLADLIVSAPART